MKKLLILLIIIVLLFNLNTSFSAQESDIRVCVNCYYLNLNKGTGDPFFKDNTIMLPLRVVAEAMGAEVMWLQSSYEAVLSMDNMVIRVPIDKNSLKINDEIIESTSKVLIKGDKTYVSKGNILESLGYSVYWDEKLNTVFINRITDKNLGLNLSHNHYWSTQWMFVDFMKQSWTWMAQDLNEMQWDISEVEIPMNNNGYPKEVPFIYNNIEYKVHTLMFYDNFYNEFTYPGGTYHLYFEGDGEVRLDGDAGTKIFTEANVYHEVEIDNPTREGINLIINKSNKHNPIRNIQFIMPGFKEDYSINPYHPKFLEFIQPVSTLRFMKPLYIEEFETVSWENRTTPEYYTQSDMSNGGLSYEYIIDLSNRTGKNPWINLPYGVDDEYVENLAVFFKENLRDDLKVYIEYANEPFNSMYDVYEYSVEKGLDEGITAENNHLVGAKYSTKRALEIFDIIDDILSKDRFVSLISCEFFNVDQGKACLEVLNNKELNPNEVRIDAVSIAPYFGGEIANDIGDRITKDLSLDNIFSLLEEELDTIIYKNLQEYKALADKYEVDLIAYEAGEHFVSLFYPEDELLIDLMKTINYDDRMEDMYSKLQEMWTEVGGGLICYFETVEAPHNYGDFGIIRHLLENWESSPKYRAIFHP